MRRAVLIGIRVVLPASIVLAGLVALVAAAGPAGFGAGIVLIGVGLLVWLANLLARMSESSNADREREEAARRFMQRHGRWPNQAG